MSTVFVVSFHLSHQPFFFKTHMEATTLRPLRIRLSEFNAQTNNFITYPSKMEVNPLLSLGEFMAQTSPNLAFVSALCSDRAVKPNTDLATALLYPANTHPDTHFCRDIIIVHESNKRLCFFRSFDSDQAGDKKASLRKLELHLQCPNNSSQTLFKDTLFCESGCRVKDVLKAISAEYNWPMHALTLGTFNKVVTLHDLLQPASLQPETLFVYLHLPTESWAEFRTFTFPLRDKATCSNHPHQSSLPFDSTKTPFKFNLHGQRLYTHSSIGAFLCSNGTAIDPQCLICTEFDPLFVFVMDSDSPSLAQSNKMTKERKYQKRATKCLETVWKVAKKSKDGFGDLQTGISVPWLSKSARVRDILSQCGYSTEMNLDEMVVSAVFDKDLSSRCQWPARANSLRLYHLSAQFLFAVLTKQKKDLIEARMEKLITDCEQRAKDGFYSYSFAQDKYIANAAEVNIFTRLLEKKHGLTMCIQLPCERTCPVFSITWNKPSMNIELTKTKFFFAAQGERAKVLQDPNYFLHALKDAEKNLKKEVSIHVIVHHLPEPKMIDLLDDILRRDVFEYSEQYHISQVNACAQQVEWVVSPISANSKDA